MKPKNGHTYFSEATFHRLLGTETHNDRLESRLKSLGINLEEVSKDVETADKQELPVTVKQERVFKRRSRRSQSQGFAVVPQFSEGSLSSIKTENIDPVTDFSSHEKSKSNKEKNHAETESYSDIVEHNELPNRRSSLTAESNPVVDGNENSSLCSEKNTSKIETAELKPKSFYTHISESPHKVGVGDTDGTVVRNIEESKVSIVTVENSVTNNSQTNTPDTQRPPAEASSEAEKNTEATEESKKEFVQLDPAFFNEKDR